MKIFGIIPARYASSRFPAKALVNIAGKSMVQRVYEQALKAKCLTDVIVATDHKEIYDHVTSFGGNVMMTRESHASGTDRCNEVLENISEEVDFVINIQGDEPFIQPEQIDKLCQVLNEKVEIATLVKRITDRETLSNPNVPKVVFNLKKEAQYFSRSTIPYLRGVWLEQWLEHHAYFKHIGIYAYRKDILQEITKLLPSSLEKTESLEQLRWIENGFKIVVEETDIESHGVDTPEDLEKILKLIKK
ncbi:MAG TPA: 3-deoxy-manno-octulosonate cytidylyltransferase [Cytophagaceae bacterium]|jgi:3-deoxy-manno-octulosonate cytidylyltransferase (CMP-KDO synthetase)